MSKTTTTQHLFEAERERMARLGLKWPKLPDSRRIRSQKRTYTPIRDLERGTIKVHVRHDDHCNNGANELAVTADYAYPGDRNYTAWGCQHEKIKELAPPCLAKYCKWHLVSTAGPLYYLANGYYHLGFGKYSERSMSAFRSHVVYGECPDLDTHANLFHCFEDQDFATQWMINRLEALMCSFRDDVQALGWEY